MWFLDGRHVSEVIAKGKPPPISYREWLLCDLNPEGAGPILGPRLRKLNDMTDEDLEAFRLGKLPLPEA